MDSLWRDHTFTSIDFDVFDFADDTQPALECRRFYTDSSILVDPWLQSDEAESLEDWNRWFGKAGFDSNAAESSLAFVLCPRASVPKDIVNLRAVTDHPAILSALPMSPVCFRVIIEKLRLHRALPIFLETGAPTIARIPSVFDNRQTQVYILRVGHVLSHHTALAITHFKGSASSDTRSAVGAKTYAFMLGCSVSDMAAIGEKLASAHASITSPFTLIKTFLELEKETRFAEVDTKVARFLFALENYDGTPIDTDAIDRSTGSRNAALLDPKNLIGLYLEVCGLKNALVAWKVQIEEFARHVDSFPDERDIDPEEYLRRLGEVYAIKINGCDTALQGTSLTFQMETAHLSRIDAQLARLDTKISLRDGKQMKAIAVLTMVFLPGTFVATLMAVPVFDWTRVQSIPQWSIYLVLFVPMTVLVLLVYWVWVRWFKPTPLKSSIFNM